MQDGYVPVLSGADGTSVIGTVTGFNRRTGKLTIQITDPEVIAEIDAGQRVGLGLTMREVPEHSKDREQP